MVKFDVWRNERSMPKMLFEDVIGMVDELDRALKKTGVLAEQTGRQMIGPACDIEEGVGNYTLSFDIPGMRREDVSIELVGRHLTIAGERKRSIQDGPQNFFRTEKQFGKFQRTFELPDGLNFDAIEAQYDNGVLTILIPKTEMGRIRKISIGDGEKKNMKKISSGSELKSVN